MVDGIWIEKVLEINSKQGKTGYPVETCVNFVYHEFH